MAKLGIEKYLIAEHDTKNRHKHNFKIEFLSTGDLNGDYVSDIEFHDVIPKIDNLLNELFGKYLPDVDGIG